MWYGIALYYRQNAVELHAMGIPVLRCLWATGLLTVILLAGCTTRADTENGLIFSYFVDPSHGLTINDIEQRLDQFQPAPATGINHPWTQSPYWLRLHINRSAWPDDLSQLAIEIESTMLSYVEMYRDGQLANRAGYSVDIKEQSVSHYNYVFLTDARDASDFDVFFKVKAGTRMNAMITVLSQDQFHKKSLGQYLGMGIFLGGALIMVGYNLVLALIVFKRTYAYYSFYTLTIAAAFAFDSGLLRQLGLPITTSTLGIFYNLPLLAALIFFRNFLPIKSLAPRFDAVMKGQIWVTIVLIGISAFIPTGEKTGFPTTLINQINVLLVISSCVGSLGVALWHGFRPARWLAVAVALSALILPITVLVVFGVVPDFPGRTLLMRTTILIELLLFSLGLADLYREQSRARRRDQELHKEEMGQLMREVHDNIATDIHSAMLVLPKQSELASTGLLQRALNNARDLASLLGQSHQGAAFSLEDGIRQYLNILQDNTDRTAVFVFSTRLVLATPTQLQMYRIFQEWMSNCLRHGGAKHFRVEMIKRPGVALMRIQSDGAPFRWSSGNNDPAIGAGLLNIQHRCANLNARIRVMAGAQSGCRFVLRMPLKDTSS